MEAQIESNTIIKTIPEVGDYLYTPMCKRFITQDSYLFVIYQLKEKREGYWKLLNLMTRKNQLERTYDGKCERIISKRYQIISKLEAAKILVDTMKKFNDRELKKYTSILLERARNDLILKSFQKQLDQDVIPDNLL